MSTLLDYAAKGTQVFLSSMKGRFFSPNIPGNAEEICREVVKRCWNGRYFQTSTMNFPEFWARDFGWCTQSLMKLGYQKEVQQTLRYALNRYKKYHTITTTISPRGRPFDVFQPAIDSLPWLIHSIKMSRFPYGAFKPFLNQQIKLFFTKFIDPKTGLVKADAEASSIKDFAVRKSSCYSNCMVALLAKRLSETRFYNPFSKYDYPTIIKQHFWNGRYFYDDLDKKSYVAGDANIFPFALGIIGDKEMITSAIQQVHESKLDLPFPLKYTSSREGVKFTWQELFFKDYESNAIWTHMGLLYIKLVSHLDKVKAEGYQEEYKILIEKCKGFPEVLTSRGKPYQSLVYYSDMSMLWACNYLTL